MRDKRVYDLSSIHFGFLPFNKTFLLKPKRLPWMQSQGCFFLPSSGSRPKRTNESYST